MSLCESGEMYPEILILNPESSLTLYVVHHFVSSNILLKLSVSPTVWSNIVNMCLSNLEEY